MRKIIIILDGVADCGKRTSLTLARKPNLNYLCKNSLVGLMRPIRGIAPESGESQFVILGNNVKDYPGRGLVEALGVNINIDEKNVYLRCNFAEFKNKIIKKIRTEIPNKDLIDKINKINRNIKIIPTIGYRAIMIVKNGSKNITNTHPGYKIKNGISNAVFPKNAKLKCYGDEITSSMINNFILKVDKLLKNKTIIFRGPGNKIPKLKKLKNWVLFGEMPIEIGLAKLLGIKVLPRKNIIETIIKTKKNAYIQIKGPDIYGHLGNLNKKIKSIEEIDKMIRPLTKLKNVIICITADHATPFQLKRHSKHPVPILIYGKGKDNIEEFDEYHCRKGSLNLEGKDLMNFLQKL
jgi:2,3-bisphosphoglycerate-independent phosphoglycerate mutase